MISYDATYAASKWLKDIESAWKCIIISAWCNLHNLDKTWSYLACFWFSTACKIWTVGTRLSSWMACRSNAGEGRVSMSCPCCHNLPYLRITGITYHSQNVASSFRCLTSSDSGSFFPPWPGVELEKDSRDDFLRRRCLGQDVSISIDTVCKMCTVKHQ